MQNQNYQLICGMEVHAELKTQSKMFCGCKNDPFRAPQPNIYTCPVCLGMPGGLPVANKKAVEWTIKLGLALGCKINLFSHFDRKNYFYPDLAKGYQISQYDQPFCYEGILKTALGSVRIRRIHLEEDTGKLLHKTVNGEKITLIDFNRSGVPLVEIVTEPDITSPEHAKAYTKELRRILSYLEIADCDMEQGGMRLEANISLLKSDTEIDRTQLSLDQLPPYRVEVKNINSFRFLEKAVHYEMERQSEILESGQVPPQETRGWNAVKNLTFVQRSKEDAEDYRYFPDPDLPPLRFTQKYIDEIEAFLPELPAAVAEHWQTAYGVEAKNSDLLIESQKNVAFYEELFKSALQQDKSPNEFAKLIANGKLIIKDGYFAAGQFADVGEIMQAFQQLTQVDAVESSTLEQTIEEVLSANQDAVEQFKLGKTQVVGFFMGQVMKKLEKKLDARELNQKILQQLEK